MRHYYKLVFVAFLSLNSFDSNSINSWIGKSAFAAENEETLKYLELFGESLERIHKEFVDETTDKQLIEAAINGMLSSLDPHSVYLNEEDFADLRTDTKGEFGGLGIELTIDEASNVIKIVSPIDDTPASKAGLQSNDLISHINGEIVQGMNLNDAVSKMRGPIGEPITITIIRKGVEPFDVTLVRDRIQIRSVRARLIGDVGYIRITQFNGQANSGLENAIAKLKKDHAGKNLSGYVLDLRNNPGGLLDQAIQITDNFLDQGEIVSTRGRNNNDMQRYQAKPGDLAEGLPIVVLINGGSASASEIVAGALQDQKRAVVMGVNSFGKGSVQTMIPLSFEGAAIKLTTQRYYTPSGRSIQGLGIVPDIQVPIAKVEIIETNGGLQERDLPGALKNPKDNKGEATGLNETEIAEAAKIQNDNQLQRALDLINGLSFFNSAKS